MSKMDEIKAKAKGVAEKAKDVAVDVKDKAKDVAGDIKEKLDKDKDGDIDALDKVKGLFKKGGKGAATDDEAQEPAVEGAATADGAPETAEAAEGESAPPA